MFGYLRVDAPNLRLRDMECYRALYCGLCRSMGRCTGQCSRLALSYDVTFLSALRLSLSGNSTLSITSFRCPLKCFRKKRAFAPNDDLDYSADVAAILSHYKILDDKTDERSGRRLRAAFWGALFHSAYRRARRRHPEVDALVSRSMKELSAVEATENISVDRPAACFGSLVGELSALGLPQPGARIARVVGCAVGHWLYLVDAADDYAEDRKKGRYNPFLAAGVNLDDEEEKERLRDALLTILSPARDALDLVSDEAMPELREILYNLLIRGLPAAPDRILSKTSPKKEPS